MSVRRLFAVVLAVALCASACSADDAAGGSDRPTVAFLRMVPTVAGAETALLDELRQAGFVSGRNLRLIAVDPSELYADGDAVRAVERWHDDGVDVIVAFSSEGARQARRFAPDASVLFISNDPVAAGLVVDETNPGGRLTGLAYRVPADRLLDVARRIVPELELVGMVHPADDDAALANRDAVAAAAEQLGIGFRAATFAEPSEIADAVASLAVDGIDALVLSSSPVAAALVDETGEAAAANGLPVLAMSGLAPFALVSLAPDGDQVGRQLGRQIVRLLTGASAAEIPVEVPRRFVLTVDASVAGELGVAVPDDVIAEAQVVR